MSNSDQNLNFSLPYLYRHQNKLWKKHGWMLDGVWFEEMWWLDSKNKPTCLFSKLKAYFSAAVHNNNNNNRGSWSSTSKPDTTLWWNNKSSAVFLRLCIMTNCWNSSLTIFPHTVLPLKICLFFLQLWQPDSFIAVFLQTCMPVVYWYIFF